MLEFTTGNFFDFDADFRINTVNCVGVMGAGVALAFKNRYPEMFKVYAKNCRNGKVSPGKPSIWQEGGLLSKPVTIINFPTKDHWRNPSKYEYVEKGLIWLSNFLKDKNNQVVVMPALGCGHGGLNWVEVKKLIKEKLFDSPAKILVFEPSSSRSAGKEFSSSSEFNSKVKKNNIITIDQNSDSYPENLRLTSERKLFIYPSISTKLDFDIALINSTRPDNFEKSKISQILDFCQEKRLSVIFGSSAFAKNKAIDLSKKGIRTAVFMPSGIYEAAGRLKRNADNEEFGKIVLVSFGDPFKSFDRKEYLPSVFGRMCLANLVIYTTPKLNWLNKYRKKITQHPSKHFYIGYDSLSQEEILTMVNINAFKLEPNKMDNFNYINELLLNRKRN